MPLSSVHPWRRLLSIVCLAGLALFGSVLRDDFTPDSDVDVLVEFDEGKTPGFAYFTMQEELSDILRRRADLKTPNESAVAPCSR